MLLRCAVVRLSARPEEGSINATHEDAGSGAAIGGAADPDSIPRHVKAVIALLLASTFIVILNETLLAVAITPLTEQLGISTSTAQWLTTAFMLTMAVVIPTTGSIIDRFSTRGVYFTAMSLFTAGTALALVAPGFEVLLAGRIVQAAGTALMMPLLITTVMTYVPASRRGATMGLISIVIAVAPAIGPAVSGLILHVLDWRWLFALTLPLSVAALLLGRRLITNIGEQRPVRFDLLSVLLSVVAFGGLVYGLSSIGEAAVGDVPIAPRYPIVVGALALVAFVLRQLALQRRDRALLDLRAFRTGTFTIALIQLLIVMGSLFGAIILIPIYSQEVLGYDTFETGLLLLPGGIAMGAVAPVVGRMFDRWGPRPLVIPGSIAVSASLWWMTTLDASSGAVRVVLIHVVLSVGIGFMMTPLFTSALGALPRNIYSHGSAILTTLQQLAGAAGTALFVTLFMTGTMDAVRGGATEVAAKVSGVHEAFVTGALLSLAAVLLALFVRRPRPAPPMTAPPVPETAATEVP